MLFGICGTLGMSMFLLETVTHSLHGGLGLVPVAFELSSYGEIRIVRRIAVLAARDSRRIS